MQELQKSDVLVLLSQFEGIPFILQEALACGVVVICSKLPGNEFLGGTSFDYVETHDELLTSLLSLMKREHLAMRQKMVRDRWVFIRPKLHSTWDITGSAISDDEQKQT
jgi:glycosyltransferase involved in cell wall biosynthesis